MREEHWAFPDLNNHGNDEGTQLVGTGGRQVGDTSTLPEADAYVCMIVCKTTMHTAFSLAKWSMKGITCVIRVERISFWPQIALLVLCVLTNFTAINALSFASKNKKQKKFLHQRFSIVRR